MKNRIYYSTLILVWMMMGCYSEDELTSTEKPEAIYGKYTLPQGDHTYDPDILKLYKKYNTLLLYKFEDKDFWWNVASDIRWTYDSVRISTSSGWEAAPANENYVGEQIELLQGKFFNYFPDTLLMRTLPLKILMCDYVNYIPNLDRYPTDSDKKFYNAYWGYDYMAINWGNEKINTMTAEERNLFKNDVCALFLSKTANKKMDRATAFFDVSTYSSSGSSKPEDGFVESNIGTNLSDDWKSYISMIVSTPYNRLTASGGFLDESVDSNGKIRQKYDIMVKFFLNNYNVDLQAIGDDVEQ